MSAALFGGRIEALLARKRAIESEISAEERRPLPCTLKLQSLKRRRLAIKESILSGACALKGRASAPAAARFVPRS